MSSSQEAPQLYIPLIFEDCPDRLVLTDKALVEKCPLLVETIDALKINWQQEGIVLDEPIKIPFSFAAGEFTLNSLLEEEFLDFVKKAEMGPDDFPELMAMDLMQLREIIMLGSYLKCEQFTDCIGFVIGHKLQYLSVYEIAAFLGHAIQKYDGYDEDAEWMVASDSERNTDPKRSPVFNMKEIDNAARQEQDQDLNLIGDELPEEEEEGGELGVVVRALNGDFSVLPPIEREALNSAQASGNQSLFGNVGHGQPDNGALPIDGGEGGRDGQIKNLKDHVEAANNKDRPIDDGQAVLARDAQNLQADVYNVLQIANEEQAVLDGDQDDEALQVNNNSNEFPIVPENDLRAAQDHDMQDVDAPALQNNQVPLNNEVELPLSPDDTYEHDTADELMETD